MTLGEMDTTEVNYFFQWPERCCNFGCIKAFCVVAHTQAECYLCFAGKYFLQRLHAFCDTAGGCRKNDT